MKTNVLDFALITVKFNLKPRPATRHDFIRTYLHCTFIVIVVSHNYVVLLEVGWIVKILHFASEVLDLSDDLIHHAFLAVLPVVDVVQFRRASRR